MLVSYLGLLKLCSDSEYPEANSDDETRASEKGGKPKKKKKVVWCVVFDFAPVQL